MKVKYQNIHMIFTLVSFHGDHLKSLKLTAVVKALHVHLQGKGAKLDLNVVKLESRKEG